MRKWKYRPQKALDWWNNLSLDDKVDYKQRFEIYRNKPLVIKKQFPNMYDLRQIRISQLSEKHIIRIWVFKHKIKLTIKSNCNG